jgi:hypothetical protein
MNSHLAETMTLDGGDGLAGCARDGAVKLCLGHDGLLSGNDGCEFRGQNDREVGKMNVWTGGAN